MRRGKRSPSPSSSSSSSSLDSDAEVDTDALPPPPPPPLRRSRSGEGSPEAASALVFVSLALGAVGFLIAVVLDVVLRDRAYTDYLSPARSWWRPAALAAFGVLAVLLPAPLLHLAGRRSLRRYALFQPFVGGGAFVALQAVGWTVYGATAALALHSLQAGAAMARPHVGTLTLVGLGCAASQVLVYVSLRHWRSDERLASSSVGLCASRRRRPAAVAAEDALPWREVARARVLAWAREAVAFVVTLLFYLIPVTTTVAAVAPFYAWGAAGGLAAWALFLAAYAPTFRGAPHRTGRRSWDAVRHSRVIWGSIGRYFSARLIGEGDLRPDEQYLFGLHVHGVYAFTAMWATRGPLWEARYPGVALDVLSASVMHFAPLLRDVVQWAGGRDATRESIARTFGDGRSVLLVPGGQREMRESTSFSNEIVVITSHKGFVRAAIRHGRPLVPVFSFGEHLTLDNVRLPQVQAFFTRLVGFGFPHFPYGRWFSPMPRPVAMTVAVGTPIEVEQCDEPGAAAVDALHARYFDALVDLFERRKEEAGYAHCSLVLRDGRGPRHHHRHHHHRK